MQNQDIRLKAKCNGVKLWQIAEALGITDASLSRKLRHELTPEDKERVMQIIQRLKGECVND